MQLIDRYTGPSLLVAATNHQQVLDPALWRRFSEVLEVPLQTRPFRGLGLTELGEGAAWTYAVLSTRESWDRLGEALREYGGRTTCTSVIAIGDDTPGDPHVERFQAGRATIPRHERLHPARSPP
ncbi:ATP-binding protein [Amycolatopsis sp. NBC_01307]|nr:ATP-binding protein [Amycolatopsis sp. NBC_01307]